MDQYDQQLAAAAQQERKLDDAKRALSRSLANAIAFSFSAFVAVQIPAGLPLVFIISFAVGFYACQCLYRWDRYLRIREGVPLV